jgi:hypothetical protein
VSDGDNIYGLTGGVQFPDVLMYSLVATIEKPRGVREYGEDVV